MKWTWYRSWRKVMGDNFALGMANFYSDLARRGIAVPLITQSNDTDGDMGTWYCSVCGGGEGGNMLPYKAEQHFKNAHPELVVAKFEPSVSNSKPVLMRFQWPDDPDGFHHPKRYLVRTGYDSGGDYLAMFSMQGRWLHHLADDDDEALVRFIEQSVGCGLAVLFIEGRYWDKERGYYWQTQTIPLEVKTAEDGLYAVKPKGEVWK